MDPDPDTTAIFDDLWATRLTRVDTQLERIANTAHWLGRKLANTKSPKKTSTGASTPSAPNTPSTTPHWVPWDIAKDHALIGLRRGMGITMTTSSHRSHEAWDRWAPNHPPGTKRHLR